MPTVTINGENKEIPHGTTIADLIQTLGLSGKRIAVELNHSISPKSTHSDTKLKQADQIEIIHAVGGG
jgi:sulfur carrier protein